MLSIMKTLSPFQEYFGIACSHFQFDNFFARLTDDQDQVVAVMLEGAKSEPDICRTLEHPNEPAGIGKARFRGIVIRLRHQLARSGYLLQ
jgi:hypothetical protein